MADRSMAPSGPIVTVFGSSRERPGEMGYAAAKRLGKLIGARGWVLCNGGHDGTMEAAAWGAKEVGGTTIGISLPVYAPTNRWLDQEIVADSLFNRLERLLTLGDACVVLRGGVGTLLELAMAWNFALSNALPRNGPRKPILVVGSAWAAVLDTVRANLPTHPWEPEALTLVTDVDEAVACLDEHFAGQLAAPAVPRKPASG
ncbi:MAG: DNA-binding protein [Chloroflexi bacterium]|nr:DNA-binding protein [Chloroflexota bacterium]